MATRTSGRSTRKTGQPQTCLPLADLAAANPRSPQDAAVGDVMDKLAQELDSVGLQDGQGHARRQQAATKAKGPGHKRKPTTAQEKPDHAEPLVVRRSRRGDRAIGSHPLVGKYRVEITSGERRWCGKYALGISTEAQLGVRLTVEAFDEVFAGEEGAAFNEVNRWANDSNFYDEQLDFVLRLWGLRQGLGRLQLGVIRDFEGAFVNSCVPSGISCGDEEEGGDEGVGGQECTTVWIHNDNAMLLGRPCNHFSGVVVLQEGS